MALTRVQSTSAANNSFVTSTTTSNFGSSVTTGNLIVVGIMTESGSATNVTSVTDTQSNTYVRAGGSNFGTSFFEAEVWYAANVTGGASFNVTANYGGGGVRASVIAVEVSGAATSSPLDQFASNHATGTGNLSAGPTSTLRSANEYIFGFGIVSTGNSAVFTAGTGFGNVVTVNTNGTGVASEDEIVASNSAVTATMTSSITNQTWGMLVATFADTGSSGPTPANDVAMWKHPTNQPRLTRGKVTLIKSEEPVVATTTTIQTITAKANILNAPPVSSWAEPVNQPLRKRIPTRQQPNYNNRGKYLVTVTNTQTITAKAHINGLSTFNSAAWQQEPNQPLRNRLPKRQQPNYNAQRRFLITSIQTITAKANIIGFPLFDVTAWKQPTNEPLKYRVPKRQQPPPIDRGDFLPISTVTQTITAVANIRGLANADVESWKQPVNQPLRYRVPKRQQPQPTDRGDFLPIATVTQTITAVANILGATPPLSSWKSPVNQPLRKRIPRRQQPQPIDRGDFLPTPTVTQTITAIAHINGLTQTDAVSWKHITNQPLRNRLPKRQQPNYNNRGRYLVTGIVTQTITAKANIRALTTFNVMSWKQPVSQPWRNRIVKRQQPQPTDRGDFLPIATVTQTITAKANIRGLANADVESWKQPVNQPLRKRIPTRQQPPQRRARIQTGTNQTFTITAKADIRAAVTFTITAKAYIIQGFQPTNTSLDETWVNDDFGGVTEFSNVSYGTSGWAGATKP